MFCSVTLAFFLNEKKSLPCFAFVCVCARARLCVSVHACMRVCVVCDVAPLFDWLCVCVCYVISLAPRIDF